jgi:hypothetical protein
MTSPEEEKGGEKWNKEEKALGKRKGGTWIKEEELWKEDKGSTVYMDVKRRKALVEEKGGRYCVHLLKWDKRRERALE